MADKITIGAGPYIQTQPYKSTKSITVPSPVAFYAVPSPVIFYDNGIAYIRWTRAGVYFLGEKKNDYSWGFSLTLQPRPFGYEATDSDMLKGMDNRKNSWEGGIAFGAKIDKAYFEIMALNDILNSTDAWILNSEIGYEFKIEKFSFYPSFTAIYQSSNYINYYYGVKENEVTLNRALYSPNAGMQFGVQTYISRPITDNLSLFANIKVDSLSQEATKSPIVGDDYIYSGILSLIYTFEYEGLF